MFGAGFAFLFYWFLVKPLEVNPVDGLLYTAIACFVLGLLIVGTGWSAPAWPRRS